MRLALARSGGVAGIRPAPAVVDTKNLPPADAQRLEALVDAAGFFTLPSELREEAPAPDSFQYSLTIEVAGKRPHTVTFSERSASEPLRELKRALRSLVKGT
jgi:hypothetical protein